MRKAAWITMTVFAISIAAYALAVFFLPGFGPPFIVARKVGMPLVTYAHLGGGALAMALGPWQFSAGLRQRALNVHRWIGRSYCVSVLIGGLGALALAPGSQQGRVTHAGFGLLALVWLFATGMAYLRIRSRDVQAHRQWMARSYALTLAAVTLRIYLPLSQVAGVPFADAYQVVSWMCWVPNLVIVEWWFLAPRLRGTSALPEG